MVATSQSCWCPGKENISKNSLLLKKVDDVLGPFNSFYSNNRDMEDTYLPHWPAALKRILEFLLSIVAHVTCDIDTIFRDTLDVVKQSAALCLLKLFKTDPSIIPSGNNRYYHIKQIYVAFCVQSM